MRIYKSLRCLLLVTLASCSSCGGGGQPAPEDDTSNPRGSELFNGYILTGIKTRDEFGNTTAVINYDFDENTIEWTSYDDTGFVQFREVLFYDSNGRVTKAEDYAPTGELERTDSYTLSNGLITFRQRSSGERLTFSYTGDNILKSREYQRGDTGAVTRLVVFGHHTNGSISDSTESVYENDGTTLQESRFTYQYNNLGQMIRRQSIDSSDNVQSIDYEEYVYDENGNNIMRSETDVSGSIVRQTTYQFEPSVESVVNLRARTLMFFLL